MDIEEDIKILEKFKNNEIQRDKLERDSRCGCWKIGDIYKKIELNIAIDHILAEREEDKNELEEWQKAYQEEKDKQFDILRNSIPKQKVKEKIEENNKLIEKCKDELEHYGEIYLYEHDNKILKELLEDK